jgi:hypothetical protein
MIVMNLAKLACQSHVQQFFEADSLFEMLIDLILQTI